MAFAYVNKAWFDSQREKHGMSMRALAKAIDIEPSALSRALNAQRKFRTDEIKRLAEVLQQPAETILRHIGVANEGYTAEPMQGFGEMPQAEYTPAQVRHPLFGSMIGTSIVMPGVDLTQPADPDWGTVHDDEYDHDIVVNPTKPHS